MFLLLLLMLMLSVVTGVYIECGTVEKNLQDFPYPEKVQLGNDYEVTIRYTNWQSSSTTKFVEKNFNGTLLITKTTRQATYTLFNAFKESTVYLKENLTKDERGYDCHGNPKEEEQNIYDISPVIAKFLGIKSNNGYASILSSVIFNKLYNSTTQKAVNITAGVETIEWVGCASNFTNDNISVQANVYFSGEKSEAPYSADFNNPQVFTIHLQAFKVNDLKASNFTITDHVSFDVVTLDKIDLSEKEIALSLPRTKYCDNIANATILHRLPPRFNAYIQYFDSLTKSVDDVEILYDESKRIFSFSSNFKNNSDIPFIGKRIDAENARIVHDFNYGLQYVLSKNGTVCHGVESIDAKMGDVNLLNGTLYIRDPSEVLFNISDSEFYRAGKVKGDGGILLDSFISKRTLDKDGNIIVVEILYTSEDWTFGNNKALPLHSIVQYHQNKSGSIQRQTTIKFNSLLDNSGNSSQTSWVSNNVYPCLKSTKDDELFFLTLENVTLDDMKRVGLERIESTLIEAIAQVGNISVLRITNFMFAQLRNKFLGCFIISEKSYVNPANTAYLMKELSVEEVYNILNNSINSTSVLSIKIPTEDEKDHLLISSSEFGKFPIHDSPPPVPSFVGYSASSMFVLGLFMFIFGATLVIGAVVFYQKRVQIRGMAYQVFE